MSDTPPRLGCLRLEFRAPGGLICHHDPTYLLLSALYRAIDAAGIEPELSQRLHDGRIKPFALSPLYLCGAVGDVPAATVRVVPAGARLWLRWCALDTASLDLLPRALETYRRNRRPLELEHDDLYVVRWVPVAPPTVMGGSPSSYADLFAACRPASEITLRFTSPVAFRRGSAPIPMDQLAARHFFGGYFERWCAFSPAEMADCSRADVEAAVLLRRPLALRPAPPPHLPSKAPPSASIGRASFQVVGDERRRRQIAALADYAWYCGTGGATTFGCGQTERIRDGQELLRPLP